MTEKLKPCPFCGAVDAVHTDWTPENFCRVICNILKGGCGTSSGQYEDKDEPIEAWNTRAQEKDDVVE